LDRPEFRALGSSQSISFPATVLNTIVAEAIDEMCGELETELAKGGELNDALRKVLGREIHQWKRIIFNGDGYSQEWVEEAERRGLLNMRSTLDALPVLVEAKNAAIFEKYNVLSRRELESRHEIAIDQYFKTVNIEGEIAADMARTMFLPAANRYLGELGSTIRGLEGKDVPTGGISRTARALAGQIDDLTDAIEVLVQQNAELGGNEVHSKAEHMHAHVIPAMAAVRKAVDKLEKMVPDDLWPVPTYRDILFIK
jgi:glutamine synthetase